MSTGAWPCVGDWETSELLNYPQMGCYEKSDTPWAGLGRKASWRRHLEKYWRLARVPPAISPSGHDEAEDWGDPLMGEPSLRALVREDKRPLGRQPQCGQAPGPEDLVGHRRGELSSNIRT